MGVEVVVPALRHPAPTPRRVLTGFHPVLTTTVEEGYDLSHFTDGYTEGRACKFTAEEELEIRPSDP